MIPAARNETKRISDAFMNDLSDGKWDCALSCAVSCSVDLDMPDLRSGLSDVAPGLPGVVGPEDPAAV